MRTEIKAAVVRGVGMWYLLNAYRQNRVGLRNAAPPKLKNSCAIQVPLRAEKSTAEGVLPAQRPGQSGNDRDEVALEIDQAALDEQVRPGADAEGDTCAGVPAPLIGAASE